MVTLSAILGAFGLAGAAGLNAYIPLLLIAILGRTGVLHLGGPFSLLTATWAIALLGVLLAVELVVDKIPGADHVNDVVQTFVRPTAGAILFAANTGVITDLHPAIPIVLGLLVAFSVHATKAAARPVLNATTLGASAPVVSLLEDIASVGASFAAIFVPILVFFVAALFVAGAIWIYSARKKRKISEPSSL